MFQARGQQYRSRIHQVGFSLNVLAAWNKDIFDLWIEKVLVKSYVSIFPDVKALETLTQQEKDGGSLLSQIVIRAKV